MVRITDSSRRPIERRAGQATSGSTNLTRRLGPRAEQFDQKHSHVRRCRAEHACANPGVIGIAADKLGQGVAGPRVAPVPQRESELKPDVGIGIIHLLSTAWANLGEPLSIPSAALDHVSANLGMSIGRAPSWAVASSSPPRMRQQSRRLARRFFGLAVARARPRQQTNCRGGHSCA